MGVDLSTRIGFSTQLNNPGSSFIRWVSRSKCSHVWWLYHDLDFDIEMVMEASDFGYRIIPFEVFKHKNTIISIIKPKHSVDEAVKHSVQWLGTMYDFAGLAGVGWVQLGRFFKRQWKNPFRSKGNVYCSESKTRGLIHINYPNLIFKDPEVVTPDNLLNFFENEIKIK